MHIASGCAGGLPIGLLPERILLWGSGHLHWYLRKNVFDGGFLKIESQISLTSLLNSWLSIVIFEKVSIKILDLTSVGDFAETLLTVFRGGNGEIIDQPWFLCLTTWSPIFNAAFRNSFLCLTDENET